MIYRGSSSLHLASFAAMTRLTIKPRTVLPAFGSAFDLGEVSPWGSGLSWAFLMSRYLLAILRPITDFSPDRGAVYLNWCFMINGCGV